LGGPLEKITALREKIDQAATRAGRSPEEIQLILVSKTVAVEKIREVYDMGMRHFGENRVQELIDKEAALPSDIDWHFIGRLQTNKVKYLFGEMSQRLGCPPLIQSLDRPELAAALESHAKRKGVKSVPCLIQVNCSREASKAGFFPEDVPEFLNRIDLNSPLGFKGVMTIGPFSEKQGPIREAFRDAAKLRERLKRDFDRWDWNVLSMGMSGDFEIAIEEGANMLRIGTAVFGERVKI